MPMIFSKDLVFVHVLKAGGVSVSQYLFKALPKPVYYVRPTAPRAPMFAHVGAGARDRLRQLRAHLIGNPRHRLRANVPQVLLFDANATAQPHDRPVREPGARHTAALAEIGITSDAAFPWSNKSERRAFPRYYDDETEELIYRAPKWVSDEGGYDRLELAALTKSA